MKKRAFTLLELSLVVLIIGILIAGIIGASSIVSKAKIAAAQTLTTQSPVNNISGLILWHETTSEKSFIATEATNNASISTWYDLNSQGLKAQNSAQTTSSYKPVYKENVQNGLPMLFFDGVDAYLETNYSSDLNPAKITVFAVAKTSSASAYGTIISSRNDPPHKGYMLYAAPGSPATYQFWTGDGASSWGTPPSSTINLGTASILVATNDSSTTKFYVNGTSIGSAAGTMSTNTVKNLRIGAGKNEDVIAQYFYSGFIGEIIVFNRVLKSEERKSVEKYLSRKWGINVS